MSDMQKVREIEGSVEEKKQYIVVKIGDEYYGMDIFIVETITRMQKITRVPKSPQHYRGVVNLRGEVVPVMSVRRKMELDDDEITHKSRIIVLRMEEQGMVGLLVDEVKEVITLGESDIDRNVAHSKKAGNLFINGIGKSNDELVSLFEISAIIDEVVPA